MPERLELAVTPAGRPSSGGRLIAYLASVYDATAVMVSTQLAAETRAELGAAGGAEAMVEVFVIDGLGGVEFYRNGICVGVNAVE